MNAAEGFVIILQKADGTVAFRCFGNQPLPESTAKAEARELVKGGGAAVAVVVPAYFAQS